MERKGQAAMEFLMTYGWAILAAIIAIAVLAYFGVFSPGKYMPQAIILNTPFGSSTEFSIKTSDISFVLTNGAGDSVDVSNVSIAGCGENLTAMTLVDGENKLIAVPCSPALTAGKFKGKITITYRTGEKVMDLTSTGQISGSTA